ncbi:MAG TPA: complex I subunit 5 family protein [Trebonia sp.]|nr:complex I subunit 5 family protein [Trebonia sp.]
MNQLFALAVTVPLAAAAAICALRPFFDRRRWLLDLAAIVTAGSVVVMLALIMARVAGGDQVYWFAGFRPARGVAIGIDFEAGSLSAGLATLGAVLVTASMTFSRRYFERVATYYHALMLIFLAGMTGFCLTGDIFDLFVWFELMGVAAYALTAYRPEERGPLQGALNFAITNSIGAYLSLSGIALVYGGSGALNMAQIGAWTTRHPGSRLVVVAFLLILAGLLVKAAIVPFHFWLADAHAVAPTPVCVLFSGVMVELGLYGIARVYWSMFAGALGHQYGLSRLLLVLGAVTAVVGALYCFRERHIKRLLAFSTISHSGILLAAIGRFAPLGLTGAAVYIIGHALVKAALFLCTGIVLHRLGTVDEVRLHGQGRRLRATGLVYAVAALGLADLPPLTTFLAEGWSDEAGPGWAVAIFLACVIVTGAAVLRVGLGVFYGVGDPPGEDPQQAREAAEETGETVTGRHHTPLSMIIPAAVLAGAAIAIGCLGFAGLGAAVEAAAVRFQDQGAYIATVLHGARIAHPVAPFPAAEASASGASVATGVAVAAGSVAVALLTLYRRRLRLPGLYRRRPRRLARPWPRAAMILEGFQSGVINDYVAWLVLGLACLGGLIALIVH